jgi:predicted metalloprotease with PDZ domain
MFAYSLGLIVGKEGALVDVVPNSPAYQGGIGPGMKLVAVNGRRWTSQVLHDAISKAQQDHHPIELIVETAEFFKTYSIPYFEGEKNPHLERVESQADILDDILKPKIGASVKP